MITREKNSSGVYMYYQNKKRIISEEILSRISKLRIPPVWKSVQISDDPTAYLQVTGIDVSGKVQYIYHPLFVSLTEYHKYTRLKEFCLKLPKLCSKINSIKKTSVNDRKYLIGLIFRVMLKTHARIGNDHYLSDSNENSSYGLTTLNSDHIKINGNKIILDFVGKHGIKQHLEFEDKSISTDLTELKKINTGRIFIDSNGSCIRSNDINVFLKDAICEEGEEPLTCKDFRTYASNRLFIEILMKVNKELGGGTGGIGGARGVGGISTGTGGTMPVKERILRETYKLVAKELGHTDAISKKSYVIPAIPEKFLSDEKYFNNSKDPVKLLIGLI